MKLNVAQYGAHQWALGRSEKTVIHYQDLFILVRRLLDYSVPLQQRLATIGVEIKPAPCSLPGNLSLFKRHCQVPYDSELKDALVRVLGKASS